MGETSLAGSLLGARVQFGPIFVASAVRSIMARASVQVVEGAGTVAPKTSPSAPGRFDCQPHEGAMNIVWGTSSRADDISQDLSKTTSVGRHGATMITPSGDLH